MTISGCLARYAFTNPQRWWMLLRSHKIVIGPCNRRRNPDRNDTVSSPWALALSGSSRLDFPTNGERGVNGYPARSYSIGDL